MGESKLRLDQFLINSKLVRSRSQARDIILQGLVEVEGRTIKKPGYFLSDCESQSVQIIENDFINYVSRGAVKLLRSIESFEIRIKGKTCLDIGVSTGGFSQVLLEQGASRVTGIDVGTDQIHSSLKGNDNFFGYENKNILTTPHLEVLSWNDNKRYELVVVDVSFVSLTQVIPKIEPLLDPGGECVALVKPQFEVGRQNLGKSGLVTNEKLYQDVENTVTKSLMDAGFTKQGFIQSPIEGKDGNKEFLIHFNFGSLCS